MLSEICYGALEIVGSTTTTTTTTTTTNAKHDIPATPCRQTDRFYRNDTVQQIPFQFQTSKYYLPRPLRGVAIINKKNWKTKNCQLGVRAQAPGGGRAPDSQCTPMAECSRRIELSR